MTRYVLNEDGTHVRELSLLAWARWFDTAQRMLSRTETGRGTVSTVFLGVDHNRGEGPPVLWETMTFSADPEVDQRQWRYMSKDAALAGHEAAVRWLRGEGDEPE